MICLGGDAGASEMKGWKGDIAQAAEPTMAGSSWVLQRTQERLRKTAGQCRNAASPWVCYFSGSCSKCSSAAKERLLSVLDLAKPRVSQLLSAWGNQKGRRLGGGMAPPRASAYHILNWTKGRWSLLMLHFELTSARSAHEVWADLRCHRRTILIFIL